MGKVVQLAGRTALVILGTLLGLAFLVMAIGAMRGALPASLSYLAVPLLFLLIGLTRAYWPKCQEQFRQRSTIAKLRKIGEDKPYGAPPDKLGLVNWIMGQAAQLPLMDAAFLLWIHKHQLDYLEGFHPPAKHSPEEINIEILGKLVQEAVHKLNLDHETAHFGTTFLRLEKLHPKSSRKRLQQAIKAAVKLDVDCSRHLSYVDDVTRVVDIAKAANPGFQERTYEAAWGRLMTGMR